MKKRCPWAEQNDLEREYHDKEWGRPNYDDSKIFELLVLNSMQAGLSWYLILKKRELMRIAFDGFDYRKIAEYDEEKIEELLLNEGIIRNRLKIKAMISNARAFMKIQKEFGSFGNYIWSFIDHQPIINCLNSMEEMPACTPVSDEISKDLKQRGFKFVGTTIIYSLMQAIGMVNDHMVDCYLWEGPEDGESI